MKTNKSYSILTALLSAFYKKGSINEADDIIHEVFKKYRLSKYTYSIDEIGENPGYCTYYCISISWVENNQPHLFTFPLSVEDN